MCPPPAISVNTGQWLKLLTYEIADVARIAREGALVQLAPVPGMHEELDRTAQGLERAREAARAAAQTRQIQAQRLTPGGRVVAVGRRLRRVGARAALAQVALAPGRIAPVLHLACGALARGTAHHALT